MEESLKKKFSNLCLEIKNSKDYQNYLSLKSQLLNHDEINNLIKEIKKLQKKIVQLEYMNKDTKEVDYIYQKKLKELESYPLYASYIEFQGRVNEMIQLIKKRIEQELDKITK